MATHLEKLLSQLGSPGRYQVMIFLLLCLNYFPLVFNHVIMAFFGSTPPYRCYSRALFDPSVETHNSIGDFSEVKFANNATGKFENCKAVYSSDLHANVSITCPDDDESFVIYQKMEESTTIVTEWDLVCSQKYLAALATTIYFCGVMVGGIIFGHLADHFGRKPVMLVTLYVPIVLGIGISFSHRYYLFVLLRFIQGVLMQGLQTSTYTLIMESFQPRHRSYIGAILECYWGFAVMLVALLAYLVQNWRYLQLVISIPSILAIWYIWFAISIGYYGLTWQLTSLPGNKYLNFFIAGAVEFFAYTLVIFITKRFGRKRPLLAYFTMASVFMIGAGVIPYFTTNSDWLHVASALAIAGKFAMGGLFSVIFLYTSELYPTIIRNIGMGACAFWTRVGGVVAPQLIVLGTGGHKSLPLIIFGVVTMIGGFLTLPLPETVETKLPDNIDDVERESVQDDEIKDNKEIDSTEIKPEDITKL